MNRSLPHLFSATLVLGILLAACSGQPANNPASTTLTAGSSSSIANPASENCIKVGGMLTIEKRGDGGEFGVCSFTDNLQCEEWTMMRGDCPIGGIKVTGYGPQGRYCTITGGRYTVTGGDAANEKGTCTFKNGKVCDGADYYNGVCAP